MNPVSYVLLKNIFAHLGEEDQKSVLLVCKLWKNVQGVDQLWKLWLQALAQNSTRLSLMKIEIRRNFKFLDRFCDISLVWNKITEGEVEQIPKEILEVERAFSNWCTPQQNEFAILDLSSLFLSHVPDAIFAFENLTELHLNKNKLRKIPDSIEKLQNLRVLSLGFNELQEINPKIATLVNLEELHLMNNRFKSIPPCILRLRNLCELDMSQNQIRELPENIGDLTELNTFNLENNNISHIGDEILRLENLEYLYLTGNPLDPTSRIEIEDCEVTFFNETSTHPF